MSFDKIYADLVLAIKEKGILQNPDEVRAHYEDGEPAPAYAIEGVSFEITPDMGLPILKSKFVGSKWAFTELEWIWQAMSNDVKWLQERGVTIWDEWEQEDGTIGKAYGWQLRNKKRKVQLDTNNEFYVASPEDFFPEEDIMVDVNPETKDYKCYVKFNQVETILYQLKYNRSSRRIMTTLWDVEDLDEMALEPCVWATHWTVQGGKLNLHVKQRSADVCLGLPFNVLQYHALHVVMAKVSGLELGTMFWNIDNAHIYDRHIEQAIKQVTAPMSDEVLNAEPKLVLPWEIDDTANFFECSLSKLKVEDYKHNGRFNYEVAI